MNRWISLFFAAIVLTMVLSAPQGWCADKDQEVPVNITSDKMVYSENGKTVTFSGDVKVVRADMTVRSNKLTAHLGEAPDGKAGKVGAGQIESIVATGAVKVAMGKRTGACQELVYDVKNGILTMKGSPHLSEGRNVVQGEIIRFYTKDSRSEVVGSGKKRVEAIFFTPKDMETKTP